MAGPWSYDLYPLLVKEAAVVQALALTDVVSGEAVTTVADGAVTQSLALTEAVTGGGIWGPWSYDIAPKTLYEDGAVSQAFALTDSVDYWEFVATASGTTYDDTTSNLWGREYFYRVTDQSGNVLYSAGASATLYFDAAVSQSIALTDTVRGVSAYKEGRATQDITLNASASGEMVMESIQDRAVSQSIALTEAVWGFRSPEYAAALQSMALASFVSGIKDVETGSVAQALALAQAMAGVVAQGIPVETGHIAQAFTLTDSADGFTAHVDGSATQDMVLTQSCDGNIPTVAINAARVHGSASSVGTVSGQSSSRRSLVGAVS